MRIGRRKERSTQPSNGGVNSLLGQGSTFEGVGRIHGTLRVDGAVHGTLEAEEAVVIGKPAEFTGEVRARAVVVSGRLHGSIIAEESVELQKGCHFEGDVRTRSLIVEEGVFFQGNCRMESDSVSEVAATLPEAVATARDTAPTLGISLLGGNGAKADDQPGVSENASSLDERVRFSAD